MEAAPHILIVEDEPAIADTLLYALRTEGFQVEWRTTGTAALEWLGSRPCAFVVLDIGLPDMSGFDVCRRVRERSSVPVLFLTARQSEIDRVVGLEIGGDDYVVKPFSPREVAARVRAILRRSGGNVHVANGSLASSQASVPAFPSSTSGSPAPSGALGSPIPDDWEVDEERCRVTFRGHVLPLTRNEYRLASVLHRRPGRVFSRDELLALAWDDPGASLDRTVDAHVKSFRAKAREVDPTADPVVTHRGLGYSWREEA